MHDTFDTLVAYGAAFFLLVATNINEITMWGGLVLLIVRLIADVPRAWRQIRSWFSGD